MSQTQWNIEPHDGVDKYFEMGNDHISMKVDYDDVNHPEVDAGARYVNDLMQKHWNKDEFNKYYAEELTKQWNEDTDLQEEYPTVDLYLQSRI